MTPTPPNAVLPEDVKQPQPVRAAFLIFSGVVVIVNSAVPVLVLLNVVSFTADQIAGIQAFLGTVTATVGATIASIYAENRVTPVAAPRNNELVPLVPVAGDGYED